jgi:hypothetical protein
VEGLALEFGLLLTKDGGWQMAEGGVWTLLVVGEHPLMDVVTHLAEQMEEMGIEHLVRGRCG